MLTPLAALLLAPQDTPKFPLTIDSIMRGPALVGQAPRNLRWSTDGSQLLFQWAKPDGKGEPDYKSYVVNRDGTGLKLGSLLTEPRPTTPPAPEVTAYDSGGDIFVKNSRTNETIQVTKTPETESEPRLLSDGKTVAFVRGGNLFRAEVATGAATQLTDFQTEDAPNAAPTAIRIPTGYRAGIFRYSPTSSHALVDVSFTPTGGKRTQVPNYVTSDGYNVMIPSYEKAGAIQPRNKTLIIDLKDGSVAEFATPRPGRVFGVRWSPDGRRALAMARAEDHKDDWILGFDTQTDKPTVLWNEHDDAWVGGPSRGVMGWYPEGDRFYFTTEKDGFANLYSMRAEGGPAEPLATGAFEVTDIRMDAERRRFTFVSSEGSPFRRHVASVGFAGGPRVKLAELSADEDATYVVSPDGRDIAVVRSTPNRPAELFIGNVQVTQTPTEEFLAGPWIAPPIVMVPSTDGVKVPARLYKPKNWRRGGPAVIFVHGAGYLQNVYEGWSHYFREYMFHHYLMSRGYAVLDMDFRASAGYGKAWRTAIYRHMGGKDLDDQIAGAQYLVKELGVAKDRIGIYGGSYGGFITFMAMFRAPDVFAAGAALRPVSDWKNYHHGYTTPILNTPQEDKEAYFRSSPVNFAEGLKGSLLICHGMVDVNVHFEDSVRLVQRLIELGKRNWEVAPYPVEDHAFTKPSSWADEYHRIAELFDRTIGPNRRK
jgi:dipeptidyl aminopeptidase/acylaminoacyl peptidase